MRFGYLDPGSASIAASVVAAGIAGAGVAARGVWGKLKRSKREEPESASPPASPTAESRRD
jgi:hypothetical protein